MLFYLVLLPAIPAIWVILTQSIEDAIIKVYLPVLLLFPTYYILHVPHLIGINAVDAVLIPIVTVSLVKYRKRWKWRRTDLWLLLFALGNGYSMATNASTGLRAFFEIVLSAFLPYVAGKMLIEQGDLRERFIRHGTWLATIVAILSIVEFRLGRNLFTMVYATIFHQGSPNIEQVRGGFMRIQGPYSHAIVAGTLFGFFWILAIWQLYWDKRTTAPREPKVLWMRRSLFLLLGCSLGMLMAMSRGPWIGTILALAISQIGFARNLKQFTITILLALAIFGGAGYAYMKGYTAGTTAEASTLDQENAVYRRQLFDTYSPIARAGGFFGWGAHVPYLSGQLSVDNDYLLVWLNQGLLGLGTFILLAIECAIALLHYLPRARSKFDFSFAMSLFGILLGLMLTLGTVAIGAQTIQLFYLLIGWSAALGYGRIINPELSGEEEPTPQGVRIFA